ncbi:MAG: DUF86 domain-containing protein [Ignisphaera sp.]
MPPPGVKARIDRFWRAVKRLQKITSYNLTNFLQNEDLIDAGERNLQVVIEAMIDVSEFLISYMKWRTPRSYRDVGLILFENGVISKEQEELFRKAVNLRNILIHNYIYMAPDELYNNLKSFTNLLTIIMNTILSYMEREGVDP